eukprot:TRINITY_DN52_c0_g1_i2.p1 TRINITY_DN52_c0_g1~~TRINITY_DN52_c0_g1_i2.p1  ORF type:complete len:205 (-),score=69.63 TRINITY_DN52_c0_g1_i2:691-1305(-)
MVVVTVSLDSLDYSVAKFPINFPDELKGEVEEEEFIAIIKSANEQFKANIFIADFWLAVLFYPRFDVCFKRLRERLFRSKIDKAATAINAALRPIHDKLVERGIYMVATVSTHLYDVADADEQQEGAPAPAAAAAASYSDLKIEFRLGEDAKDDIEISKSRAARANGGQQQQQQVEKEELLENKPEKHENAHQEEQLQEVELGA